MICLRCGYCCHMYFVEIVDDQTLGLREDGENIVIHGEVQGIPCKHLKGDTPGFYKCLLHDEPWYHQTDCAAFSQTEKSNCDCRIGAVHMEAYSKDKLYFRNLYELAYKNSIFIRKKKINHGELNWKP